MKTKIILISTVLVFLFLGSGLATKALPQIIEVQSPETIKLEKTFEIKITFDYSQSQGDCLYGDYIWIWYRFDIDPYTDFSNNYKSLAVDVDFPRQSNFIAKVDTSGMLYKANGIFLFKIKYIKGYESGISGLVYDCGEAFSEFYEITSVEEASISTAIIILPLLLLSTTVLIRKKKIKMS